MTVVPQAMWERFLGTVTDTYVLRIDLTDSVAFRARGFYVLNMDASIVVTVSWAGSTDEIELDPADAPSLTLDNFTPPNGTVYIKAASGTPRVQAACWG